MSGPFPLQTDAGPLTQGQAAALVDLVGTPLWGIFKSYFAAERGNSATRLMDIKTPIDAVNYERGRYGALSFLEEWVEKTLPADYQAALDILKSAAESDAKEPKNG